jgi:hypothetical protein
MNFPNSLGPAVVDGGSFATRPESRFAASSLSLVRQHQSGSFNGMRVPFE